MSWLNFFQTTQQQKHAFGRGINANISPDEEKLFIASYEAFERGEILEGYALFFDSLINFRDDISNENITYTIEDAKKMHFVIFQGCARVSGVITEQNLYAESIICKKSDANVALKRYILERNYQLTYANYFANDEHIMIKLYHDNKTMSPQKVFFPLREIALNADYDKEHIVSEFESCVLQDTAHTTPLSEDELRLKYEYLLEQIELTEQKVLTLPSNDNASMQSFLYLKLLFSIDYLLVPKYKIYQRLSKTILEYFSAESMPIEAKNEELKRYTQKLKNLSFEEFSANFYDAKYTFNQTEKSSFGDVENFISESITKIRWYKNNRYTQIIPTIYKYMAFYILYNFGLNPAAKELLHTLVEVQNSAFFTSLGYTPLYDEANNSFSKRAIINKLDEIVESYQPNYPSLVSFASELNFNSLNEFSHSFYLQFQTLNFEEI